MKNRLPFVVSMFLMIALLAACAGGNGQTTDTPPPAETAGAPQATQPADSQGEPADTQGDPVTLNVMTHDSFAATEDVIRQFEQENNIRLSFIRAGDAGSALNRAILSKNAPIADVFYGIDNTFLSRALEEGIFEKYESPLLEDIPDEFEIGERGMALPVDYGDVCINYDKAYFEAEGLAVPQSLADLTKPEYRGLLVVQNPATSSPGMAFLLATIDQFGEDGYLQFWEDLRANDVVVANDWESAYYTNFSGSSGQGPQPMVVSYNASPVAEVVFAETPPDDAPTGSIVAPGTCYRQIEFVGILSGTAQREAAEKFVDFMLSPAFQEDIPLQMFVYPVNPNAELPEAYQRFSVQPESPAELDPALIAANREAWITAWNETVLR